MASSMANVLFTGAKVWIIGVGGKWALQGLLLKSSSAYGIGVRCGRQELYMKTVYFDASGLIYSSD